ncbi:MAG: hypothetical protein HUK20_01220 [Fibrobacter sp.]|nr:hypothetical protein [Fibrobacter sp.]
MRYPIELCRKMVQEYTSALSAVLNSQSYSIGGRSLTRANLAEIEKNLDKWSTRLDCAESGTTNGRPIMRSIIPHG